MLMTRIACQKIRWRLKMNVREFAKAVGVSAQYVSAVELGSRTGGAYLERVAATIALTASERQLIARARRRAATIVRVAELTEFHRELVGTLADKIGSISDEDVDRLVNILGVPFEGAPSDIVERF